MKAPLESVAEYCWSAVKKSNITCVLSGFCMCIYICDLFVYKNCLSFPVLVFLDQSLSKHGSSLHQTHSAIVGGSEQTGAEVWRNTGETLENREAEVSETTLILMNI